MNIHWHRKYQKLVNGHVFKVTQHEPNKMIEITCQQCGYIHTDVHPDALLVPMMPIKQPCPG
jgi:hypothetical protein